MSFFPPAIGAGIDIATTAQAQAGTDDTTAISPLKMREGFNASGSAPVFACRAWVNFDGTTTTPTIRASGNVSSVVRNSTGDYTINFVTDMPDANYAPSYAASPSLALVDSNGAAAHVAYPYTNSTSNHRVKTRFTFSTSNGDFANFEFVNISIFR